MNANDKQVGGTHYKQEIQHWDFAVQNPAIGDGYLVGQVTKYLSRWQRKNGVQDLEKALHFLEKLREVREQPTDASRDTISAHEYVTANEIPPREALIILSVCNGNLTGALRNLRAMVAQETGKEG